MDPLWIVVEDYDPELDYSLGRVISLTAEASWQLSKNKIPYEIPAGFDEQRAIVGREEAYFLEQLRFFKSLDSYIREYLPALKEKDLTPAKAHYSRIKYVWDTLVMNAQVWTFFFAKGKPNEIVLVREKRELKQDYYDPEKFRTHARSVSADVLIEAANALGGITVREHLFSGEETTHETEQAVSPNVKAVFKKMRVKALRNYFLFSKWRVKRGQANPKVLILDAGNHVIDEVCRRLLPHLSKTYLLEGNHVNRFDALFEPNVLDLSGKDLLSPELQKDCQRLARKVINDTELFTWIKLETGLDLQALAARYFAFFCEHTLPGFITDVLAIEKFMKDQGLQGVVARSSAGSMTARFLSAARLANVKTFCFQHGYSYLHWNDCIYDELGYFDVYFSSDDEAEDYFKSHANAAYINVCKVYQAPISLKRIQSKRGTPLRSDRKKEDRPVVLYLERKAPGYRLRLNSAIYFLPWYFEMQKKLFKYFASRQDFVFIYKHSPDEAWAKASILPFIASLDTKNIRVEERPFPEYLSSVDRVILDFPSSGVIESVVAKVPVLSLHADFCRMHARFVEHLGPIATSFSSEAMMIEKMDDFLNAPAERFLADLGLSGQDYLPILMKELIEVPHG